MQLPSLESVSGSAPSQSRFQCKTARPWQVLNDDSNRIAGNAKLPSKLVSAFMSSLVATARARGKEAVPDSRKDALVYNNTELAVERP